MTSPAPDTGRTAASIPERAAMLSREHLILQIGKVIQDEILGGSASGNVSMVARRTAERILDGPFAGWSATALESSR